LLSKDWLIQTNKVIVFFKSNCYYVCGVVK
jgi:hypothetical protein